MKGKICKVKHIQEIMLAHLKLKTMMLNCLKRNKNKRHNIIIRNGQSTYIEWKYYINK